MEMMFICKMVWMAGASVVGDQAGDWSGKERRRLRSQSIVFIERPGSRCCLR